jgi:hypothetical protein
MNPGSNSSQERQVSIPIYFPPGKFRCANIIVLIAFAVVAYLAYTL